jgi:hypothetical protein
MSGKNKNFGGKKPFGKLRMTLRIISQKYIEDGRQQYLAQDHV